MSESRGERLWRIIVNASLTVWVPLLCIEYIRRAFETQSHWNAWLSVWVLVTFFAPKVIARIWQPPTPRERRE